MSGKTSNSAIVWDLPTRVFHWLLLSSYVVTWLTYDDNRFLFVHVYAGYVFLALLVFRLVWGLIGTHYARFHSFAHDWASVSQYIRGLLSGEAMRYIGHNPAGGWAIFAMLLLGFLVSIAGVFVLGGEEGHGPLAGLLSYAVGIYSHQVHEVLAWVMLAVTVIHVLGVIVESIFHKENLVWSMLTGHKEGAAGVASVSGHHYLGLLILVTVVVSSLTYFRGYLVETADNLYQPYKGPVLPDNASWRENCSECHFVFHPSLLPARSWQKIFDTQHEHFGDDLDLDDATLKELLKFHLDNAAERGLTEPSRKILFYTPENETPMRITGTQYWKRKHADIKDVYWTSEKVTMKGNCAACHLDAKEGTYEDSGMRLPKLDKPQ